MKGQALADFVLECTISLTLKDQITLIDKTEVICGQSTLTDPKNEYGSCAGVIIEYPDGYSVEYSIMFRFKTSNNIAKYELALARIELAKTGKARRINNKFDSQLVVG